MDGAMPRYKASSIQCLSDKINENHPSGAKALVDSMGLTRGLKPPSPSATMR